MLNIYFYVATGLSVLWAVYSSSFINGAVFFSGNANIGVIYSSVMVFLLPIIAIWGFVALLKMLLTEKHNKEYIAFLMEQVRKNAEVTNILQQSLLNTEKELKNNFVLQEFNMLVSDTNEVLSDIIKRSNSVSSAQIEHLWERTSGGERWLLAKTFIEINNYQPNFAESILNKAKKNTLLKGSILEFHHRYKNLNILLDSFDNNRAFFDMVEYGALGKVYDILSPVAEALYSNNDTVNNTETVIHHEEPKKQYGLEFPSFLSQASNNIANNTTKEGSENTSSIDVNLEAIRDELLSAKSTNKNDKVAEFSKTKQALNNFKKQTNRKITNKKIISIEELEREINSSPENNYNDYDYPLGVINNDKNN